MSITILVDGVPTQMSAEAYAAFNPPPAPQPDPVPESVTNSDWRVGLILWGRFAEVEAKVIAARDSGTVQGAIVWQRWEYASEVLRTELLALHDTFGFTTEEVDESLIRAAKVPEQTRAQAEAVLAARAA